MDPERSTRVVGARVKAKKKVVEEVLEVSIEHGEGDREQVHSKESKVVEVVAEENKAQEFQTSVPSAEDDQSNKKAEEEKKTDKRGRDESKEAPEEVAEEPPNQEREGRGEVEDREEPSEGEEKQKKEETVEGEEERERKEEEEEVWSWCGGRRWRVQEVCVQGAEAGASRDGGVVEGNGGARRHDERHVREAGGRGGAAGQVHGKVDTADVEGDPGCSAPGVTWGARQACHFRGDQTSDQLHVSTPWHLVVCIKRG